MSAFLLQKTDDCILGPRADIEKTGPVTEKSTRQMILARLLDIKLLSDGDDHSTLTIFTANLIALSSNQPIQLINFGVKFCLLFKI